jgi:hypothetical protein
VDLLGTANPLLDVGDLPNQDATGALGFACWWLAQLLQNDPVGKQLSSSEFNPKVPFPQAAVAPFPAIVSFICALSTEMKIVHQTEVHHPR